MCGLGWSIVHCCLNRLPCTIHSLVSCGFCRVDVNEEIIMGELPYTGLVGKVVWCTEIRIDIMIPTNVRIYMYVCT